MDGRVQLTEWLALQDQAERPFRIFEGEVPPEDLDLSVAVTRVVVAPSGPMEDPSFDDFAARARNLARQFQGRSELVLLNAKLIILLRRRDPPTHVAKLFQRLWVDHHSTLRSVLSPRWLISSAQTLADHGATEIQRRTGASLATLFGALKLSESERLFSPRAPDAPFRGKRQSEELMLGISPYAVMSGDLDRVLLTRLWRDAFGDPVAISLVEALILPLMEDPRTVFARLRQMRAARDR